MLIVYIIPVLYTIISLLLGIFLLRKHIYILILPWMMSFSYLFFTFVMYWSIEHDVWLFSLLYTETISPFPFLWAIISTLTLFACAMVSLFIIAFVRGEYIEFNKKYIRIYVFATLIPIAFYLLFWFHFNVIYYDLNSLLFIALEFINIIIFLVKRKHKQYSKTHGSFYVKLGISTLLLGIIIIKRESITYMWYLSNGLLYYLCYTVGEVKRSKEENYPHKSKIVESNIKNIFFEYIPITCIVFSCILISIINHIY